MLAMLLFIAAPALAQEGGAFFSQKGEPTPSPPDYAYRNGEVYVDGDEVLDCRTFVESFDKGYDEFGDQAQARRVLARCEQAGTPTVRPPAEVRRDIRQDAPNNSLPETGGVPLSFLAAGVFLTGAGLLALRAT